ncbi:hypothetical protein ACIQ6V_10510 [Streptomyces sp. NPDC096198]
MGLPLVRMSSSAYRRVPVPGGLAGVSPSAPLAKAYGTGTD